MFNRRSGRGSPSQGRRESRNLSTSSPWTLGAVGTVTQPSHPTSHHTPDDAAPIVRGDHVTRGESDDV